MRMWQVVILINMALAVGLAVGYGAWCRRLAALGGEVETTEAQVEQLKGERDACFAGGRVGEQPREGRGIVRAVYPKLFLGTREEIPGLLPARTTGFRLADFADRGRAHVGDPIRFWLRGTGYDNPVLVKMEAW
jgi:hypothetical protein